MRMQHSMELAEKFGPIIRTRKISLVSSARMLVVIVTAGMSQHQMDVNARVPPFVRKCRENDSDIIETI